MKVISDRTPYNDYCSLRNHLSGWPSSKIILFGHSDRFIKDYQFMLTLNLGNVVGKKPNKNDSMGSNLDWSRLQPLNCLYTRSDQKGNVQPKREGMSH